MKKFRFLGLIPALLVLSIVFTACGGMPSVGGSGSFALTGTISAAESNVSADLYVDVNVNVDVTPRKYYVDPQVLADFQAAIAAAKAIVSNESSTDVEIQATATALGKATAQFLVQRISLDSKEAIQKSLKAAVDFANAGISAFEASAGGIEGFDVALLAGVKNSITVAGSVSADENASVSDLISTSIVFVNETINFVSSIVFKAPLYGAIYLANFDNAAVVSSADGKDVKPSKDWVTPQDLLTFENAIAAAQLAYDTPGGSQQFYNDAKDALNTAKAAFDAAKQKGTQDNSVDRTALAESITIAMNLRAGVIVAASGDLVSPSAQWATFADAAAFTTAINAARSAYYTLFAKQADLDTAKASLDAAISVFKPQLQYGTKSNAPNFSPLQIALNAAIASQLDYTLSGGVYVNAKTGYSITTDQYNALTTVMSDAQAIINNAASTTAQITAAVKALSTATFSFKVSIAISVKVYSSNIITIVDKKAPNRVE